MYRAGTGGQTYFGHSRLILSRKRDWLLLTGWAKWAKSGKMYV